MTLYYADPQVEANIALKSRTVSGEQVPGHDVISLPGNVEADIGTSSSLLSTISGFLSTLAGAVSASRVAVDLTSTVTGYLQTLAGAISSSRMQVDLTSTINTYLSNLPTIATNQGVPSGGPKMGYLGGIGTGANANFASKTLVRGCVVTNLDATNNLLLSIGGTPGSTNVDTYTVFPRTSSPFIACTDPATINMRASAATLAACYAGA